ncbi:hypothetical protein ACS0TY_004492 [Phlomoides rotata]
MVDLPLGAAEDRVCSTIDIEKAPTKGVKAFEPVLSSSCFWDPFFPGDSWSSGVWVLCARVSEFIPLLNEGRQFYEEMGVLLNKGRPQFRVSVSNVATEVSPSQEQKRAASKENQRPVYPFAVIVGQGEMKLCLLLNATKKKIIKADAYRESQFFDNIYQLVGVPVVTVQLQYNGWVTELMDLERARQLRQAAGLDNLLYTPDADFSYFADLALSSPEDYYLEDQGSLLHCCCENLKCNSHNSISGNESCLARFKMKKLTKEECIHILRCKSTGFFRGSSKYRGVTLDKYGHQEARMGQFLGKK